MTSRAKDLLVADDPLWYKDAILYELHPRAFYDSNGDGIGDFPGLIQKLDYLQDLGITAIWLLPFYPSPLKDDGYDISDYNGVHPNYGTLPDFKAFLQEANRRDLRVITELVLNHTSDQHAWFQKARQSESNSPARNFYVWNNTADKYREARIIFKDFEASNWAWDPVAKAYYWHRFYSHQPDLNFDNPLVRRAMLQVIDFWLAMGVSGLRLDAVPYLYEKDGTNCENLPETHAFLKKLRRHVDELFKGRMLLGEANQWAEDAAAYFGNGDECHMAFHFPLMPRLFMAIRMESRFPIVDILHQTPPIPDVSQWALFLRNHDELTLEMVSDEERDYMYRMYAEDTHSRINLGIRRRLAPLLNNDRRKIELMNGLLFSLPGTPVIYYGDEIGMGDNIYLGDRNGVRTPMQWSAERNAGFSAANSQQLYLPIIVSPEYHYETVNVEVQQNNRDSLLWWTKRTIALRKRFKALGRGSLEFLYPENRKVLAFLRRYKDETILVVANLSRLAQPASLNLAPFQGRIPVEVQGQAEFPPIGEAPYPVTLGPYAFYWFSLESPRAKLVEVSAPATEMTPVFTMGREFKDLFRHGAKAVLEAALLNFVKGRRWFGGKARPTRAAKILDTIPVTTGARVAHLVLLEIEYGEGEAETYLLPLAFATGEAAAQISDESPQAMVFRLKLGAKGGGTEGIVYDAVYDKDFCQALLRGMARRREFKGSKGEVVAFHSREVFRRLRGPGESPIPCALLRAEQTNTSIVYGDRFILKLYRHLETGISPELEMGLFLTEKKPFPNVPPVAGALEYRPYKKEEPITIGIMHGYTPNEGDAWRYTLDNLGRYFEWVLTHPGIPVPSTPSHSIVVLAEEKPPPVVEEAIGAYLISARLLGKRTAELHLALAVVKDDPNFAPEPFSIAYQQSLYHTMRGRAFQALQLLRQRLKDLPEEVKAEAQRVLEAEEAIMTRVQAITKQKITGMRLRGHGDYHLGQVLFTGKDFVIIDFEGEPARPLSERRIKRSPLSDVAGMIRSFHYAAFFALLGETPGAIRPKDLPVLETWARSWYLWVAATFLKSYLETMGSSPLLPGGRDELKILLEALLLEKAVYEVGYELNNRPDWVKVPLLGILSFFEGLETKG